MERRVLLAPMLAAISLAGSEWADAEVPNASRLPPGFALPVVIYDVDWSDQVVGQTPQRPAKEWLETVARDPWQALPWRTYSGLDYVTRDRTAIVHEEALGLDSRPLLFSVAEAYQPHWGPRMSFPIPPAILGVGRRYRISLDLSVSSIVHGAGVTILDIGSLRFSRDSSLLFNGKGLGRYSPSTPFRVEFVVDVPNRTLSARLDDGDPVMVDWEGQQSFYGLRLDGVLPGGFNAAHMNLAFDNIKIVMEE